ncbi:MAG TPA: efflux RND transporter periplasmic adaptor subunit [Candidatus Paceibacterota bacterium]|nr:efflux RND transporter periplasmic adaptor subunit [Candidatus Paceibacterota bacterium]
MTQIKEKMKNCFLKCKNYFIAHKVVSIVILIVVLSIGFWAYKKVSNASDEVRYVTTNVEKGTIITSVSGTGQVSASNQVDLKAKASGDIVAIGVKSGQRVSKDTLIAQIDSGDMQKSLRDAELSLQSAKISLQKAEIQNSEENRSSDLQKAYEDGLTAVADAFLDLPTVITGVEDAILSEQSLSNNVVISSGKTAVNYLDKAENLYYETDRMFQEVRSTYRTVNRNSTNEEIENVVNETYETVKKTSDMLKSVKNLVDYLSYERDGGADFSSIQNSLTQYINTVDGHLSDLYSSKQDIKTAQEDFSTSGLDLESYQISVRQKQNSLNDLKEELSDYYIRAPFDGIVADIAVEKSDSISSGTTVATFITDAKIAEIPFNEVDIAQIKTGQKATLTFDAISDLTISGEVVEVDSVGTVSSGVVNYDVKINFDTQDERIKPGMSVTASVIIDTAQDVLVVPTSAVKTKNNISYVEIFSEALTEPKSGEQGSISSVLPEQKVVEIGLSDDTSTEIVSGLQEGDIVVTKTINGSSSSSSSSSAPSILNSFKNNNNNKSSSSSSKSSSNNMRAGGPPLGM